MFRTTTLICALGAITAFAGAGQTPTLRMTQRVDHLDVLAREPMVVEAPDGALFVAGYGSGLAASGLPALWKSGDHGATWIRVNVGTEAEGAVGNSDVDLAVAPDGTLYYVIMTYDNTRKEGLQIAVGASRDSGAHWKWRTLSRNRFDDRPWIKVASDGTAHVIWNHGSGVLHATSTDFGATWTKPVYIAPKGGSSHLAVGPNRQIAVRVPPLSASGNKFDPGVDQIVVSTDGGTTWKAHIAPGERAWSDKEDAFPPRWVEPIAWDAGGNLYSFWTNDHELWLGRSPDNGETWKSWKLGEQQESSYFPYLVARGNGELACSWFSGQGAGLQAHAGLIRIGSALRQPRFVESAPFQIDAFTRKGDRDTGGEYLGIAFLRGGGFAVVSPIQNLKDKRLGFTWMRFAYPEKP
jgi:hypothetical protein